MEVGDRGEGVYTTYVVFILKIIHLLQLYWITIQDGDGVQIRANFEKPSKIVSIF
jgi:hypothetical protein